MLLKRCHSKKLDVEDWRFTVILFVAKFYGRFLQNGSNVFGSNYEYELSAGGSSTYTSSNGDTHFEFDVVTNGNAAGEGPGGYLWLYNINNNDFIDDL